MTLAGLRTREGYRLVEIEWPNRKAMIWARDRTAMPRVFCLEDNYEETAKTLGAVQKRLFDNMRTATRSRKGRKPRRPARLLNGYYDFTTMEQCSPSAALILASYYDVVRSVQGWDIPLIEVARWSPNVRSLLHEIGFFDLLELKPTSTSPLTRSIKLVEFRTGAVVAREDASDLTETLANMLVSTVPGIDLTGDVGRSFMQLFGALQEATENTCDHAYKGMDIAPNMKRWWITGAIDAEKRHMTLAVYDNGWTIPATLRNWEQYGWIQRRLARARQMLNFRGEEEELDGVKMRLAMDVPRSSTGMSHRGKGFPAFKFVVEQSRSARLRILSRRGEFIYEKGKRPQARALKTALNGTLVEWDLWL